MYMGHAMQKLVFEHTWILKAQISLYICAVYPRPSLSANKIIGYYRLLYNLKIDRLTLADGCFQPSEYSDGDCLGFFPIEYLYLKLELHQSVLWLYNKTIIDYRII